MKHWLRFAIAFAFFSLSIPMAKADTNESGSPDMYTLAQSGFVMSSSSTSVHQSWAGMMTMMKSVKGFDSIVQRMTEVVCGNNQNKSVLLVGEPNDTYRLVFARLAVIAAQSACPKMHHVEIDINKIESGHIYVGQVEEYWQNSVLKPSDGKDVVLYFRSLAKLIGLGSHSGTPVGIESEYVANMTSGRIRSVAYMDKYQYNYYLGTRNSYVLTSFAEKIDIEELPASELSSLIDVYMKVFFPQVQLQDREKGKIIEMGQYFMPGTIEPQRSMMILNAIARNKGPSTVTLDDVRKGIMALVQVPAWIMDRDYSVLRNIRQRLDSDVVGVDEAKISLTRLANIGYAVGRTDTKPIASSLLVGPTGTGKSYIAKKFAQYMGLRLITIDMTSYATDESFDRFLDVMAQNLTLYPYAIYLFEEIDKANVRVLDRLYFMLDEGVFYDLYQRPLFARGAFIMMTTNAAENVILDNPNDPNLRSKVDEELRKMFRPSFLNRFDDISMFTPFTDDQFRQLAHIMVSTKASALKKAYGWTLTLDEPTYEFLATKGHSKRYGARPMERLIENVVSYAIAEYQINVETIPLDAKITLTKKDMADKPNLFTLSVEGRSSIDLEVDTRINDGGSFVQTPFMHDLLDLFAKNRVFQN